ncbi:MAG: hypothetical protein COV74_00520 [Candidatus Omnitrophica bacterium CG11_big_fil_rev_8_21_14_0_20_45_26]|uniref:SD-repeat containing protein B domain-containing protein n=1 Tax=Candidatus Abzuiibacterium crystallinum TaxID=1974748 RepID=A0A2H0LSZ3_9BACT|nr:MAG: hypothetical protein COV74_00520 [Candidatus Omnitrophica bacterium CG11_big_fil_rev_8_21_14_0_20_45_26]PIW63372.1 MAG: hypothetical protein COW12_10600 [Candidatus Omnitrophica bacterium CG12_big_fil_rev_8_21_14_0_65_45_16]
MKWSLIQKSILLFVLMTVGVMTPAFANELGNPSFEIPNLGGSSNWDNTANRGITVRVASDAPDGQRVLTLSEALIQGAEMFTFTFQTVPNPVKPGDHVAANAFIRLNSANDGNEIAQIRLECKDSRSGDVVAEALNGTDTVSSSFARFEAGGPIPDGCDQIVVTLRIQNGLIGGTSTADFDDINLTINGEPIGLGVEVTKNHVPQGGGSYASILVENQSAIAQSNLELVLNVPNGLNIVDDKTRLNQEIPDIVDSGQETRLYTIGNIGIQDDRLLSFLIVVSPGAIVGHTYTLTLYVRDATALTGDARERLSQLRSIPITVIADPFFTEGTVIGKVFDDQNENGIQDKGESGVPSVQLATEEGIVIRTDFDGKYHIPAVQPGRHVIKIDAHSLPSGTHFVTEETRLIKMTDGMITQADFAVKLPESMIGEQFQDDLRVMVSQGSDFARPHLSIQMMPAVLRKGEGLLEQNPVFLIDLNYADLVTSWRIEVRDERGEEIWNGYGIGAPPKQAPWQGKMRSRQLIEPGVYAYRLAVQDSEGREDWTALQFFKVIDKRAADPDVVNIDIPETGFGNIARDGKRGIPIAAKPTILVRGQTAPDCEVSVNGQKATSGADGSFQIEIFTEPGPQAVLVSALSPEGKTVTYQEDVVVKDTTFFMVGLAEEEIGFNITNGNLEAVGRDDQFHQSFYQDGRAAYYLKGKIKGRFLVTSRYDTQEPLRHKLFTNLDPDHYYPVYGDDSQISYEARDTQERLYVLAEMDRSFIKVGSYRSDFNETELATFDRTLSGLKVHFETLGTTPYGDAKRGFTVFAAKARSLADHNEFVGTGGSLYYLRNKQVIEGSEQVKIEARDELQGLTIKQQDLSPGTDYEIDYVQGRVLLRQPLSSVWFNETILDNQILDGHQVYLVVDYEFEAQDLFGDQPAGIRGFTHLGDHLRVGGTAVRERRQDQDYDLRGVDAVLKVGKNTKISAEYAKSKLAQTRNAVSYNGGITFQNIATGVKRFKNDGREFDGAWSFKAESRPIRGMELSGYVQQFSNGFSNADDISQKGYRKAGIAVSQKFSDALTANYRFDEIKNREGHTDPDLFSHSLQVRYDDGRYVGIGEYRHESFHITDDFNRGLEPIFERQEFSDGLGLKLGYRLDQTWLPYIKGQLTRGETKPNHKIGGGIEANLEGVGKVRFEEMVGNLGDSALIGFERQVNDTTTVYTQIESGAIGSDGTGKGVSTTIGSSQQVNQHSRLYSEREYSSYDAGGQRTADTLGYDVHLNEHWNIGVSGERARIRDLKDAAEIKDDPDVAGGILNVERTAGAVEFSYMDVEKLKFVNRLELRFDRGDTNRNQWLSSHSIEWQMHQDYKFLTRLNRSMTIRTSDEGNLDNDYVELSAGIAYRPAAHNKLNLLARYTWLRDIGVPGQFGNLDNAGIELDEMSQILGLEGIYQISRYLTLGQKLGYKWGHLRSGAADGWINFGTFLTATRLNFHVTKKWDLIGEYRIRFDHRSLDSVKSGVVVEIDREFFDYALLGVGYNFTDFGDDIRQSNGYTRQGFYTRVSGKF